MSGYTYCTWTFGLFPLWDDHEYYAVMNVHVQGSVWTCFQFSWEDNTFELLRDFFFLPL